MSPGDVAATVLVGALRGQWGQVLAGDRGPFRASHMTSDVLGADEAT